VSAEIMWGGRQVSARVSQRRDRRRNPGMHRAFVLGG